MQGRPGSLACALMGASLLLAAQESCGADDVARKYQRCTVAIKSARKAVDGKDWARGEALVKKQIEACTAAGSKAPYLAGFYLDLAFVQRELKRPNDVLATVERCLAIFPQPYCHYFRVDALNALGRKAEAAEARREAISACRSIVAKAWDPDNPAPYHSREEIEQDKGSAKHVLELLEGSK